MEKKLKVLIAENTAEFGVPCSNLLKTYGMDVVLTPKEGSRLFTEVKSVRPGRIYAQNGRSRCAQTA